MFEFDSSPTPSVEGKNEWNVYVFLLLVNLKCNNSEKMSDSKEIIQVRKCSSFFFKYNIGTRGVQLEYVNIISVAITWEEFLSSNGTVRFSTRTVLYRCNY